MRRTLPALLGLALLAAACGDASSPEATTTTTTEGPTTTVSPTTPPEGNSDVLLMIRDEGGFAPIEFILNNPPTFVLLNDGTLIFQGVRPGAFPGPLMPGMQQMQLTQDQMDDIMVLIEASGLPEVDEVFNNDAAQIVADAGTTVAVYWDDNGDVHEISVYALGIGDNLPDDLANLLLLRTKLSDLTFAGSAGEPYAGDRMVLRVVEGSGFTEINDVRTWEFAFGPAEPTAVNGFPCLVLEGSEAADMKVFLSDATQATQWEHETGTFTVLARDLLPGESGCEAQ